MKDKDHATFELSNFGIYNVDENISIYHTQRFEGHDGVSILTHTEKNKGVAFSSNADGPINPLMITSVFHALKHYLVTTRNLHLDCNVDVVEG